MKLLEDARALLATPENWHKDYYASDGKKQVIEPKSPNATCWCGLGALYKAGGTSILDPETDEHRLA